MLEEEKKGRMEKIYINCDRKNIALLTGKIIASIKDIAGDKLYLKYVAEETIPEYVEQEESNTIKSYQRNDKIVIYAENSEKAEAMSEAINQTRIKYPKLFSSKKYIPLIPKKYGFIGIGKGRREEYAKFPSGIASGVTYNDFMADMMLNSVISGFDKHFSQDPKTSRETNYERLKKYMEIFPQMKEQQQEKVIGRCQQIFRDVCKEYKINTVYKPILEDEKNIDNSTKGL